MVSRIFTFGLAGAAALLGAAAMGWAGHGQAIASALAAQAWATCF